MQPRLQLGKLFHTGMVGLGTIFSWTFWNVQWHFFLWWFSSGTIFDGHGAASWCIQGRFSFEVREWRTVLRLRWSSHTSEGAADCMQVCLRSKKKSKLEQSCSLKTENEALRVSENGWAVFCLGNWTPDFVSNSIPQQQHIKWKRQVKPTAEKEHCQIKCQEPNATCHFSQAGSCLRQWPLPAEGTSLQGQMSWLVCMNILIAAADSFIVVAAAAALWLSDSAKGWNMQMNEVWFSGFHALVFLHLPWHWRGAKRAKNLWKPGSVAAGQSDQMVLPVHTQPNSSVSPKWWQNPMTSNFRIVRQESVKWPTLLTKGAFGLI